MSALNNTATSDVAMGLLRQTLTRPWSQVSEDALRETNLDVDMLTETYEHMVKPYLDYLSGYENIQNMDPRQSTIRPDYPMRRHWDSETQSYVDDETWALVLKRWKVKRDQAILVVKNSWTVDDAHMNVNVYITRAGKWLLWQGILEGPSSVRVSEERMFVFASTEALWQKYCELVPTVETAIMSNRYDAHTPKYLPLTIAHRLGKIVQETVDIRLARIRRMQDALKRSQQRAARIAFR